MDALSVATAGQLSAATPAALPAWRSMLQRTLRSSWLEPRPPVGPDRCTHTRRHAKRAVSHGLSRRKLDTLQRL